MRRRRLILPRLLRAVATYDRADLLLVLAIDVSLSMRANDIEPTRIAAAQAAAKTFVGSQPSDVRIALVSFAGSAAIEQLWLFILAPVLGALIAGFSYAFLVGQGAADAPLEEATGG